MIENRTGGGSDRTRNQRWREEVESEAPLTRVKYSFPFRLTTASLTLAIATSFFGDKHDICKKGVGLEADDVVQKIIYHNYLDFFSKIEY